MTAATAQPVHAAFANALAEGASPPAELQYMPPGRHRIRASRGGQPVEVDVSIDAATAATLQTFLARQLSAATAGREDRPFFDFNHEDREASAWPTEFYWAGEDPLTGGVRARIEWSEAGQRAIAGRTFRRFSPTFHLDAAGRVTGSETNMGGLVNRAAFKRIAPLFAAEPVDTPPATIRMQTLISTLHSLGLVEASATEEADLVSQVTRSVGSLKSQVTDLQSTIATQARQRAEAHLATAIKAGRVAAKDADAHAFWTDALLRDEAKAIKALESLPAASVLDRIVPAGTDAPTGPASVLARQEQKLAAVRAAHPSADFQTIYAKAKAEAPELFR
jgi:phage I-like protein